MNKVGLVFVHGAGHGAWCWKKYEAFFKEKGVPTFSIDLPGHGTRRSEKPTAEGYFSTVAAAVKDMKDNRSEKVIVVGYSLGGVLVEKYLASNLNLADGGILIATGGIGKMGKLISGLFGSLLRHPKKIRLFTNVIPLVSKSSKADPQKLKNSAFFSNRITLNEAKEYAPLICPEPEKPTLGLLKLHGTCNDIKVPVCVLASRGDAIISPSYLNVFKDHFNFKTKMIDDACHDMMLDPVWKKSAEIVYEFTKEM